MKRYKKEIRLLDARETDRILHIGCGTIPYTSLLISDIINGYIVCIDNKKNIVHSAAKHLKKFFPTTSIELKCVDGKDVDVSSFNNVGIGKVGHDGER